MSSELTASEQSEVRRLSGRIERVEMARVMVQNGDYGRALEILEKLRLAYDEPAKKALVQTLIEQAREAQWKNRPKT